MQKGSLKSAELVIAFATSHYSHEYSTLLNALSEVTGTENIVGCSSVGVLTAEGEIEGSISLSLLAIEGVKATPFLASVDEKEPGAIIGKVVKQLEREASPGDTALLLADPLNVDVVGLIGAIQNGLPGVSLIGGVASTMSIPPRTYQWAGKEVTSAGVAGVVFPKGLRAHTGVAQGCKPIGRPYVVTSAQANVVLEIGNLPATQVLREAVESIPQDEAKKAPGSIFCGIAIDERIYPLEQGDFLIRHMVGADEKYGAIAIGDLISAGQTVQFQMREAQSARNALLHTLGKLSEDEAASKAAFGLYFNCLGRGEGLYGMPHHDTGLISSIFPNVPVAGFFGNAEIGPVHKKNALHTYGGVLALFSSEEESA